MAEPLRVLLVDDDETISQILLEALRRHGYEDVSWEPDGRRGVEAYRALRPDLVLMDITMPLMDGYEASCRIKAIDPTARIIVLTGNSGDPRARRILKEGVAECVIQKPIRLNELRALIERPASDVAADEPCTQAFQAAGKNAAFGSAF